MQFVRIKSDLINDQATAVLYEISYYMELHYNGYWLCEQIHIAIFHKGY